MKKIISFSLWGNIRLYCIGAIKNALLAKIYFPEWICRYYYDNSVPEKIINYLKSLDNTELIFIEKPSGAKKYKDIGQFGMFWRFFPFNDDDVEIWMPRDIDSRLSKYEAIMIENFLKTDKIIHTFSDINEKIMRGCGSSFRNYVNNKDNRYFNNEKLDINILIKNINQHKTKFYEDENFLNNIIFPLYKNSYLRVPRKIHNKPELFNEKFTGKYVGQVLDEYDRPIDKNKSSSFNSKNNYDDLELLLNNYKKQIGLNHFITK